MKKASGNINIFLGEYNIETLCQCVLARLKKAYITKEDKNLLKQIMNMKEYKVTVTIEELKDEN